MNFRISFGELGVLDSRLRGNDGLPEDGAVLGRRRGLGD